ncbi:MAG: hypothetical protein COB50_01475, partial [Thiotrichales bacterium]
MQSKTISTNNKNSELKTLSYEDFTNLTNQSDNVAVYKEIATGNVTPVLAWEALGELTSSGTLLETSPREVAASRYSFLCLGA